MTYLEVSAEPIGSTSRISMEQTDSEWLQIRIQKSLF